ncbi:baeRF2 domain-containing protein [Geodermatophilus chilensis]|uniref:baeRF2 domain-containing protein n=1 Tax=Geodermatophilus chilensis TaxID=2035835 RepID=UPI000C257703|nr:Vms1/Ankzf1 family peptidyl-tRNA hydrolase [Geodermatophilus chilensis]
MDVSFLAPVFSASGPYATVCADVTHTTENADTELELRVRALAERLEGQGAPEAVVEAVRSRLLEANEGGEIATLRGRALVVAADGSVVLDQPLVDQPRQEVAEYSPTPDLMPVLRQMPGRVPHVVVLVDRTGGDITYVGLPGQDAEEETVKGETWHIRKVKVGGWAHDHWQNSAEGQWEDNADRVAERIASYARRFAPRFVLVAGDIRARNILADRAGDAWKDLVVTMEEGGRAAGADREAVDRRAAELVAEHEAHEEADTVEKVQAAAAHGLAVTGTAPVVEALRKSQVETLVLADQPDDEKLLVGPDPLLLGTEQGDMDALGVQQVHSVPAERALVAAAVASDAGMVVVPRSAMPGDIPVAAILRYTDDSTPTPQ